MNSLLTNAIRHELPRKCWVSLYIGEEMARDMLLDFRDSEVRIAELQKAVTSHFRPHYPIALIQLQIDYLIACRTVAMLCLGGGRNENR